MTTLHTATVSSSGNRGFLFLNPGSIVILNSILTVHTHSPPPLSFWLFLWRFKKKKKSPQLASQTSDITQLLSSQSRSLYSFVVAHILIWTFHSANIDKVKDIESTPLHYHCSCFIYGPYPCFLPGVTQPLQFLLLKIKYLLNNHHLCQSLSHTVFELLFLIPFTCTAIYIYIHSPLWELRCCMQVFVHLKVLEGLRKVWISNSWI